MKSPKYRNTSSQKRNSWNHQNNRLTILRTKEEGRGGRGRGRGGGGNLLCLLLPAEDLLENSSVLSFLKCNFTAFFAENASCPTEPTETTGGKTELSTEKGKKKPLKCNVFLRHFIEE